MVRSVDWLVSSPFRLGIGDDFVALFYGKFLLIKINENHVYGRWPARCVDDVTTNAASASPSSFVCLA